MGDIWGNAIGAFGLVITIATAFATFAWWIEGRFSRAREERLKQIAELRAELTLEVVECFERSRKYTEENRRALDQINSDQIQETRTFQMNIYKDFVREKSLSDTEARIMTAVREIKEMLAVIRNQQAREA